MTDTASQMAAQLTAFANRIAPVLDRMSYYQLLNVPPNADIPSIRRSFYQAAAQLHPDRYHTMPDGPVKEKLVSIYARICEGYRGLVMLTGRPDVRWYHELERVAQANMRDRFGQRLLALARCGIVQSHSLELIRPPAERGRVPTDAKTEDEAAVAEMVEIGR